MDDGCKVFLFLPFHIFFPCPIHIHIGIDGLDETLDEFLLATKVHACTDCLRYAYKYLLVLAVAVVILLHQHQDVVNVYLHLTDEFGLEDEVIVYHLLIRAGSLSPLLPQIKVVRLVVLHLTVGE